METSELAAQIYIRLVADKWPVHEATARHAFDAAEAFAAERARREAGQGGA